MSANEERLREVLTPLIHEESSRIDSFLEDDLEGYIKGAISFHIEEEVVRYVKAHPHATAQELYHLLAECEDIDDEDN